MKNIEITKISAATAYKNADANGRKLLEDLLGLENISKGPVMDRIKTFDDVLEEHHPKDLSALVLLNYNGTDRDMISAQAYLKLTLIARALNEGWEPDWSNSNERKYTPWFKHQSGFGLSYDGCVGWNAHTFVGSRLCYKSSELAVYAAKQFADIYNDYLTIK